MAKAKKKSAKEASETFHNIMGASVNRPNKFYFAFQYIVHKEGQIEKNGVGVYESRFKKLNTDEVKKMVRLNLHNPAAVVTLHEIREISKEDYEGIKKKDSQI